MGLVSVIVPIYKVEDYLERCISSILNQTWADFELILVDDGSPDGCPLLCDQWRKKDSRIKVIHKENGGLSDARNSGLKIASGEFIAFVDSDDWVSPDYLQILVESLQKNDCDIIECGIIRTRGETDGIRSGDGNTKVSLFQTEDALKQLIKDGLFHQYVWNKLYKRSVIDGIFFEKGKTNEDEFWTYRVFGNAKRIGKIEVPLYYYFQRAASIMGEGYSLKRLDALEAKMQRQKYIEQKYPKLKDIAGVNLFTSCIYQGQMAMLYLDGEALLEAKKRIGMIAKISGPEMNCCKNCSFSERVWIFLAKSWFWGTCRMKNYLKKGF